jgi:hypothetical protein
MLKTAWQLFGGHFTQDEVGIKQELMDTYWTADIC